MAIYVNKNNGFEQTDSIARECPHCGAHAQLLPVATPSFEALVEARPRHVGIVYRCAACNEPRFVRAAVRGYEPQRVELAPNLVEVERPRERFQYSYLPATTEPLLREAFECYTSGSYNAFASMSRRTLRNALTGLGPEARRRWQDSVRDVLLIGEIETATREAIEETLFGDQPEPPVLGADEAAVLIEVLKDLLYQSYVRTAKLKAALKVRRFFAGEGARNVTSIGRGRREAVQ